MDGHWAQLWTDKVGLVGQITVRKYKLLVTFTGWIPKTFSGVIRVFVWTDYDIQINFIEYILL